MHRKSAIDGEARIDIFIRVTEWSGEVKNCEPYM